MTEQILASPLWRWSELCRACGLEVVQGPDIRGISIDSRSIGADELFIALSGDPGPRFHSSGSSGLDGHDYIDAAIAAGAAGLMVSRAGDYSVPSLQVEDTLDGLWNLGCAARQRMNGHVVAVTGSAGKTTFRQWLSELLQRCGRTHASVGSLNNHWGVPLSLARMPEDSEYGIFEVGTNNPGEIAPLSTLVAPHIAVLLNVLPAHLGRFENLAALREEKCAIAEGLNESGVMIVPVSLGDQVNANRLVTFGLEAAADVKGKPVYGPDFTDVTVEIGDRQWQYRLNTTGEHRVLTSLAVCAVLHELGVALERVIEGFASLTIPAGRGDTVKAEGVTLVDDSYNANPVSMKFALAGLSHAEGQQVAILGEMLELGDAGVAMHRDIAKSCTGLDGVITVGEGFADWPGRGEPNDWGHFDDCDAINLDQLAERLQPVATVLVKGSNKVFWTRRFVGRLLDAIRAHQEPRNRRV